MYSGTGEGCRKGKTPKGTAPEYCFLGHRVNNRMTVIRNRGWVRRGRDGALSENRKFVYRYFGAGSYGIRSFSSHEKKEEVLCQYLLIIKQISKLGPIVF